MYNANKILMGLLLLLASYQISVAQEPFQYTTVTQQPLSEAVAPGAQATFTAVVVLRNFFNPPYANQPTYYVTYNWLYNSNPSMLQNQELDTIVGTGTITVPPYSTETPNMVTTATITLPIANAQSSNAGAYELVYGQQVSPSSVEYYGYSNAVSLYVSNPPVIVYSPQSQALSGSNTFSVTAGGALPLSYQWSFNGTNIPGATNSSYTLTNPTSQNAGSYSVTVSNSYGTATASASLFILGTQDTPTMPQWALAVFGGLLVCVAGRFLILKGNTPAN